MGKRNESGQVVILMVVGIISLLGFAALAIDGARLFSEKRTLQGVSDTAAFTAAAYVGQFDYQFIHDNWYVGAKIEPHAEQAALERIRSNGYVDQEYNPFGGNDKLMITIDPVTYNTEFTSYIVKITIISEVKPIFAQLVYHDPIMANAYTEAVVWPKMNMAYGRGIFATAPDGDRRIELVGNSNLDLNGSGVYALSTDSSAIYISGSTTVEIEGTVAAAGGVNYVNGDLSSGGIINNAESLPLMPVPTPQECSALATSVETEDLVSGITWHTAGRIITPTVITGGHHIYESGWYCIYEDFQINAGIVESETGGVMFYFPGPDDSFTITGGVVDLQAAQNGEANDHNEQIWDGMLIYIDESNTGVFAIMGHAGSYLAGSVYAPGPARE